MKKTSQTDNAAIWHARLGHLGYQMLQQISSKRLIDGMLPLKNIHKNVICQGCQYRKSHCLPFKNTSNHRLAPFELVHVNLMGPTKTRSRNINQYAMIMVDDFPRFTWVYFLKEKNEALSKFIQFYNNIEKEFDNKIKCLRSDIGDEFMSADFFQFCEKNGI